MIELLEIVVIFKNYKIAKNYQIIKKFRGFYALKLKEILEAGFVRFVDVFKELINIDKY